MNPEEGFIQANGLRLHYLRWGKRSLPPAVLLHATGFLARLWQPVAEALSERFQVYAYDARGHGDSDKPPHDYRWPHFVSDLRAVLDALGLRNVLTVGHSGGGAIAAYLAATEPAYISRLVLFEPIIVPPQVAQEHHSGRNTYAEAARSRRMVWPDTAELIRTYRERPTFARWRGDILRLYAEHGTFRRGDGQIELKCPGHIEAQLFENSVTLDTWSVLPHIRCPTLVMRGEHTDPFLRTIAESAAHRIPGARLVIVPDAGHLAPMERPDTVAREILTFVGEEPRP